MTIIFLTLGAVLILLGIWFLIGMGGGETPAAAARRWILRIVAVPLLLMGLGLIAAVFVLDHLPKPSSQTESRKRIELPNIFIR